MRIGGSDTWNLLEVPVIEVVTGLHDLYFVFSGMPEKEFFKIDYWKFNKEYSGVLQNVAESRQIVVYDICGVKVLETPDASLLHTLPKGIYIVEGKKVML